MTSPRMIVDRWMLRHPRSLGESYAEHAGIAVRFAFGMIGAGAKCLIHAVVPGVFETAASDRIRALHRELERRSLGAADHAPDYVI